MTIGKFLVPLTALVAVYVLSSASRQPRFALGFGIGFGGLIIMALVALIMFPVLLRAVDYATRTEFDQARWKSGERSGIRIRMVDDLLKKYPLVGWSERQVEVLLGKPPETDYFRRDCDWVYWLGPERGFISIDSEWLCVKFQAGAVVKAVLVRD